MSKDKIIKKITVKRSGKNMTFVKEQVLPEDISDSEIERIINDPVRLDPVGDLREFWIAQGYRPCAYVKCTNPLLKDAHPSRKYCSEQCRNAERQRRFREKSPEKVYKAQKKYWSDT